MKIKIDLVKLDEETANGGKVRACYFSNERETTEGEKLARDILAPLAVAELMRKEGTRMRRRATRETLRAPRWPLERARTYDPKP